MPTFACSMEDPLEIQADALAIACFKDEDSYSLGPGASEVDDASEGGLSAFLDRLKYKGEKGEVALFPFSLEGRSDLVIVIGVGEREKVNPQVLREVGATLARRSKKFNSVVTTIHDSGAEVATADAVRAVVEGVMLGGYEFLKYRREPEPSDLSAVIFGGCEPCNEAIAYGTAVGSAVNWARDLVNEPAGRQSPAKIAETIKALSKDAGLSCEVWDSKRILKEKLGGVSGVGAGSVNEPRLVKLEYKPSGGVESKICLVGKGVVFDSGGLSLKPAEAMETMKTDMSGAAAVAAAMSALSNLDVRAHVIAFMPFVENMPSGSATKPGDVLQFRNGKTAEVLNTDAEGRLILADALVLASDEEPAAIVDLATLTGACMVALGYKIFGVMSNDDDLAGDLLVAADEAGERGWRLPLPADYKKQIESEIADMKNIGSRYGGALTAGLFLEEFIADDIPWAHLDIAGPARSEADEYELPKGGTGVGVRTLLTWLVGIGEKVAD